MQPDMLVAALPTDLHLYARPPASYSILPRVLMSWPPMQFTARPRSKLRPTGRSYVQHRSRTLASSTHFQASSNRQRTLSTGGMSYGKLPRGACGLIRSLRVSRLANRHDTESNISPTIRFLSMGSSLPSRRTERPVRWFASEGGVWLLIGGSRSDSCGVPISKLQLAAPHAPSDSQLIRTDLPARRRPGGASGGRYGGCRGPCGAGLVGGGCRAGQEASG